MISVHDADKIIFNHPIRLSTEKVDLRDAYGRILQETVKADRDQPPFDKATMDGIAIAATAIKKGVNTFKIQDTAPAGRPALKLKNDSFCIKIMTGAVVPKGCDCVVPIEHVTPYKDGIRINAGVSLKSGQNIRKQGSDRKRGEILLEAGTRLSAPQIAAAASVGKSKLRVVRKLKIAIISTGDELVDVGSPIRPYQTRRSNSYALDVLFRQSGLTEARMFHFPDNKKILYAQLKKILAAYDIIVSSGGVSMGEFDYLPQVLQELDVEVLFHKVTQKPGKPLWFGIKKGKTIFALPGNPVSTQVCALRYVVPFLQRSAGLPAEPQTAILGDDTDSGTDFTYFLPVKIRYNAQGHRIAEAVETGGSGDYASLALADGIVELGEKQRTFRKGTMVPFYSW